MASAKTFTVTLFCCAVLLSAVTAHAALTSNGITAGEGAPIEGSEGLPFILISQKALGKTHP
jgi:hypothetical protein